MKEKKIPMRRCAGCMESKPKSELIRIAGYEGKVSIDPTGRAKGRGVYLCPCRECFEKAQKKRAIGRSLDMDISSEQLEELFGELKRYEK
ncbi:MAG: RNase P modulator RnpM [Anaerovoracaceae bacterium]